LFASARENWIAKIPDNVRYAEASVLPLGMATAASALFQADTLALRLPQVNPKPTGKVVLIWGGSSSVGACGIQLVVGAGFDVATTASSHNLDYCKTIGAKYVFDHAKDSVVEDITTALKGVDFGGVFCAIINPDVIIKCAQIASELGGNKFVSTVLPTTMPLQDGLPSDVKTSNGEMKNSHPCL
jgi:NADPH:quinone reductase-like Zn-dependent oxidoreductase